MALQNKLPYGDLRFDFVLIAFCISYFSDLHLAFKEANRVLKQSGSLVIGFLDKTSKIGKEYEERRHNSTFYKTATFYTVDKIVSELKRAGFRNLKFCQTLFHNLNDIRQFEHAKPGYGEGSFVVIQAKKS
jgi:ubiquinone/menaquinone biosynthesis C-methylase UbiE